MGEPISGGASGTGGRKGKQKQVPGSAAGLSAKEINSREYNDIDSSVEQRAFLNNGFEKHFNMTEAEKKALDDYKGDDFMGMNAYLRQPEFFDQWLLQKYPDTYKDNAEYRAERKAHFINSVKTLQNAPTIQLGRDMTLYRKMSMPPAASPLGQLLNRPDIENLVGAKYRDDGFGSTTVSAASTVGAPVRLIIRAPKETKVWIPDPNHKDYGAENEVLFKPGTTYNIRSAKRGNYGELELEVDIS
jgi:hypothetical protein